MLPTFKQAGFQISDGHIQWRVFVEQITKAMQTGFMRDGDLDLLADVPQLCGDNEQFDFAPWANGVLPEALAIALSVAPAPGEVLIEVGIPIALYLQARNVDKESFLRAIALTFLISASMLVLALIEKGAISQESALISAISLVPAFAGMMIGQRLRGRLSEDRFRMFVYLFLLIAAANLIRKGIF